MPRHVVKIKPLHALRPEDDHFEVVCETCVLPEIFRVPVQSEVFGEAVKDRHIRNMESKES